jgi:RHS repeat-associated protein
VALVPDILGTVIASVDSASGALIKIGYLPYGKSGSAGPFGFTGQRIDMETSGLYYFRARHYSPAWGRFLQVDPSYSGPSNLYAYVTNDPLNSVDPLGLYTLQIGIAGGGTFLGIFVPQGGAGFAIDTKGNVGVYAYAGIGVGVGVQAGAGLSIQGSNAQTIFDLSGKFTNTSAHGGAGFGGSADYFAGSSPNGPVVGGGATVGASVGASASITQTTTTVCTFQGCVGSVSDLLAASVAPTTAFAGPSSTPNAQIPSK